MYLTNKNDIIHRTVFTPNVVEQPEETIIKKETVVKKLRASHEIVGLEGEFEDEIIYKDTKPIVSIKWLDRFSKRQYIVSTNGHYKFGIKLNDLKNNHIIVNEKTGDVKIIMPKIKLISFELNYDAEHYKINKHSDTLAKDFTTSDDQSIYKYAYDKAKSDILHNNDVQDKAMTETQTAIKKLLTLIPGVKNIEFIEM
jgi:hypothetical protein